jgi:hypothetical protein
MGSMMIRWHGARQGWAVAALIAALGAAVGFEAMPAPRSSTFGGSLLDAQIPDAAHAIAATPPVEDWADAALGRPLFAINRRPPSATTAQQGPLPRLSGTIRFANTALAIFQPVNAASPGAAAKSVVVGLGASLAGWTVADIANGSVMLVKDGRSATIRLGYARFAAPPHSVSLASVTVLHDKRTSVFFQP